MEAEFNRILAEVRGIPETQFDDPACKQNLLDLLVALRGYLTEAGTTPEQDDLLMEDAIRTPQNWSERFAPRRTSLVTRPTGTVITGPHIIDAPVITEPHIIEGVSAITKG